MLKKGRKPERGVTASKRTIVLVTPMEDRLHFALAAYRGEALSELIRRLLEEDAEKAARQLDVPRARLVTKLEALERAKKHGKRPRA